MRLVFDTCFLLLLLLDVVLVVLLHLPSPTVGQKQPLQLCRHEAETLTRPSTAEATNSSSLSSCTVQREEEATLRHHLVLQQPEYRQKVILKCPLCAGESATAFVWHFLPRSTQAIFKSLHGRVVLVPPGGEPLSQDRFSGGGIPCLVNQTNDLFIANFDRHLHVGTYYCRNVEEKSHLANFIWYHLDVVLPLAEEGISRPMGSVPVFLQGVQKAANLKDAETVMASAGEALKAAKDFVDFSTPLLSITSRLTTTTKPLQTCGQISLFRYRRCYITLPRVLPPKVHDLVSAEMILTYELLRNTFASFYTWMDVHDPAIRRTQREAAEVRASEMGFDLFYDGKEEATGKTEGQGDEGEMEEDEVRREAENRNYYIPCHFTYLQHVNLSLEFPRPFATANVYVNVSFDVPCPEVDYMEIINLVLATKDSTKLKREILGYEEKRFMKLDKVAIEGSPKFDLLCGGEADTRDYNCSDAKNFTVLWRQAKGVTYTLRTFFDERVYVTSKCSLRFERVKREDEGLYSCYKRDLRRSNQWQTNSFATFRLKIEKSTIKFPTAGEVSLGLLLLTIWAIILIFVWLILSIWSMEVNRAAIIEAGERMRRREKEMKRKVLDKMN